MKIFVLLLSLLSLQAFPQVFRYDIDKIPANLKKNANAVIRESVLKVDIRSENEMVYFIKTAITLLNRTAISEYPFIVYYDKSSIVKNIMIHLYDKNGKQVGKVPASEIHDQSAVDGFSLFTDNRYKWYTPSYNDLPYTMEYDYEIRCKNTLLIPSFIPVEEPGLSVEQSRYELTAVKEFPIRYRAYNSTGKRSDSADAKRNYVTWSISNIPSFSISNYELPEEYIQPKVRIAPVSFVYEGYKGNFTTWQEYGVWTYKNLLEGRDKLPEETATLMQKLTAQVNSKEEKVKIIYNYVQKKTRYVSIQKGIGGLRPMTATEVDQLGYGDCKALSNYTMALLKSVNIPSFYTEIYGDRSGRDFAEDFPSLQGNHIILAVPLEKDTMWLECTNDKSPAGYLGTFTDNRKALLCYANGAKIVRTKVYHKEANIKNTLVNCSLDTFGNLTGLVNRTFEGIFFNEQLGMESLSEQKKKENILGDFTCNQPLIVYYSINVSKEKIPRVEEKINFKSTSFAGLKKDLMIVPLSLIGPTMEAPDNVVKETDPFYIRHGFTKKISYEILVPKNYTLENIPTPVSTILKTGMIQQNYKFADGKLMVDFTLMLNEGVFPAAEYKDLILLYKSLEQFKRIKLIFQKVVKSGN